MGQPTEIDYRERICPSCGSKIAPGHFHGMHCAINAGMSMMEPAPGPIWTNGLDETAEPAAVPPCPAWCPDGPQGVHNADVRIHRFEVLADVAEDTEGVEVPVRVVLERADQRAYVGYRTLEPNGAYETGATQVRLEVGHAWNQPLEVVLNRQMRVRVAAALLTATSLEAAD
jgi:hypothetical protein